MAQNGGLSPSLEDPPLPEFRGATLHLASGSSNLRTSARMSESSSGNGDFFVDLVNYSGPENNVGKIENKSLDPFRKRRNTSPDGTDGSVSPNGSVAEDEPKEPAEKYFSSRASLLERALQDCKKILLQANDGPLLGYWLLTVVDHWDNEKERLVLLCGRSLFIVKYDFIALLLLDHLRVPLNHVTFVTIGRLEYPPKSIAPKLQQAASRVSSLLRTCLLQLGQDGGRSGGILHASATWRPNVSPAAETQAQAANMNVPEREGVRISWRGVTEPKLAQLWNPWSKEIPWLTFLSHPLVLSKEHNDPQFDVQDFITNLRDALQSATPPEDFHSAEKCIVEYKPIMMESYVGLPALVHNTGQLGFYKVRGKISF